MFSMKMPNIAPLLLTMQKTSEEVPDKVLAQVAQNARDIARATAPHLTGTLARSIYCNKVADGYEVGSPLVYAWAVEFGSGVYGTGPTATGEPIGPTSATHLSFKIGGEWIRVRYVMGQHPQPFLRPACEQALAGVDDIKVTGLD